MISKGGLGDQSAFLWVLMITSAENRAWPSDVPVGSAYANAGLPSPSIIRTTKIATIDASAAEAVGRIDADLLERVKSEIGELV